MRLQNDVWSASIAGRLEVSPASSQPNTVLFLSHSHDNGVFKVGSHHLARELARMDLQVAHVSTPFSMAHALFARSQPERMKRAREGVRIDTNGVKHLIPGSLLPAQYSTAAYLVHAMKAVGMERPDIVFVDQPLMLCKMLFETGATTIYRPTDLYLRGAARRLQSKYVERCGGVAATSGKVLESLPTVTNQPRMVIPNGVEYSRFHAADPAAHRSGAVYVGALDSRFDWDAIIAMARAHPSLKISLVGPVSTIPTGLPPNVEIQGPMSYQDVPQHLARFSVGLLPLSDDPSNAGRSPMKLFEYLAAGLYVVATAVRGLTERPDLPGCFFYTQRGEAAGALGHALAMQGSNTAGMESARAQDWREKARQLLHFARSLRSAVAPTCEADCIAR